MGRADVRLQLVMLCERLSRHRNLPCTIIANTFNKLFHCNKSTKMGSPGMGGHRKCWIIQKHFSQLATEQPKGLADSGRCNLASVCR